MEPVELKFCEERGRLMDLLHRATIAYGKVVCELASKIGTMTEGDYRRVRGEVEQARLDAEQARHALINHRGEHGC